MRHSKLPWVKDYGSTKGHIKSINGDKDTPTVCLYDVSTPGLSQEEKDGNGQFITIAVNNYYPMLKLLFRLRKYINFNVENGDKIAKEVDDMIGKNLIMRHHEHNISTKTPDSSKKYEGLAQAQAEWASKAFNAFLYATDYSLDIDDLLHCLMMYCKINNINFDEKLISAMETFKDQLDNGNTNGN